MLGVLAGWLEPTRGTVRFGAPLDGPDRGRWHRTAVVPQSLGVLPELSLLENVGFAHRLAGAAWHDAAARGRADLDRLGIGELGDRRPSEVSLGQQQRAAVARALTAEPALLLADEPTAHLDAKTTMLVLDALEEAAAAGSAVVVASHDPHVLERATRAATWVLPGQSSSLGGR
jgi:putative ABC transport system ATP-binding protein